jgi:type IV secretory pathway VirJ component
MASIDDSGPPVLRAAALTLLLVLPLLLLGDSAGAETITHGRFRKVEIFLPVGQVRHFAFLLSGDGGWTSRLSSIARILANQGTMVAGIDTAQLYTNLEEDTGSCVFPDGDLENLSHYIQAYYKLPTYFTPLLIGHSAGASMVYAMLAQAPRGTFGGALSLSFCVDLDLGKPLCRSGNLRYTLRPHGAGAKLLPAPHLSAPWTAIHGSEDGECPASEAKAFVAQVQGARFIELPGVGHNYHDPKGWLKQFNEAYASIAAAASQNVPAAPASLAGLPLVEVPAASASSAHSDTFAVLFSGDGGWAGIDKEVATKLAEAGIPVAGVDSLRYFWSPRTPAGMAQDLARILQYYASQWHRKRALVIGYSQGADVLPFAVNRLPATTRPLVKLVALIGISSNAAFEFHVANWLGGGDNGLPTAPEIRKLSAADALCVYGDDDSDSICPQVNPANARVVELSGGHHFGGDYDKLAKLIVDSAR